MKNREIDLSLRVLLGSAQCVCLALLVCLTLGTSHAQTAGIKPAALPPTIIDPSVSVFLEKNVPMPGIESRRESTRLSRIVWSEVTNQIAASAFVSAQQYVVDPDSGKAVVFEAGISGLDDTLLQWSRKQSLLIASKGVVTKVYDTAESPAQAPRLIREIKTAVPRPLIVRSVSITASGQDEWMVLGGETNRELDPGNPDIAAFSLATGQRKLEWQFPSDGTNYYLGANASAGSNGNTILAGWVHNVIVPGIGAQRAQSTHTMWVIDLTTGKKRCEFDFEEDRIPFISLNSNEPSLSSDGRWLVMSAGWGAQMFMNIYNLESCERVVKQRVGANPAYRNYAFSPNGKWLVAAMPMFFGDYDQGRLSMWRTSDWKLVYDAPAPAHHSAAFNKTSDRFAVGLIGNMHIYRITER